MSKNPARLNDPHDCPKTEPSAHSSGTIITTTDATVLFQGQPIACEGDKVKCEDGSETTIQTGNACVVVNNKRVALVGDKTDHGGKITSGADAIHIEEGEPFVFIGSNVSIGKNVSFNKKKSHASKWKSTEIISDDVRKAIKEAMKKENIPDNQYEYLAWIVAQESGGHVDSKNPHSSARGLFQLTRANYQLNPNGENSFGNPIEETQGGIRYIKERYGTPENAVAFWKEHKWY